MTRYQKSVQLGFPPLAWPHPIAASRAVLELDLKVVAVGARAKVGAIDEDDLEIVGDSRIVIFVALNAGPVRDEDAVSVQRTGSDVHLVAVNGVDV